MNKKLIALEILGSLLTVAGSIISFIAEGEQAKQVNQVKQLSNPIVFTSESERKALK